MFYFTKYTQVDANEATIDIFIHYNKNSIWYHLFLFTKNHDKNNIEIIWYGCQLIPSKANPLLVSFLNFVDCRLLK